MIEQIQELFDKKEELSKEYMPLLNAEIALKALKTLDADFKLILTKIEERKAEINVERTMIDEKLVELQSECDHNDGCAWDWVGNDSHKDYYECNICGKGMSI